MANNTYMGFPINDTPLTDEELRTSNAYMGFPVSDTPLTADEELATRPNQSGMYSVLPEKDVTQQVTQNQPRQAANPMYSPYWGTPTAEDITAPAVAATEAYEGAQQAFRDAVPIANYIPEPVKQALDQPAMSQAAEQWAQQPVPEGHWAIQEGARQAAMGLMNLPANVSPAISGWFTDPKNTEMYRQALETQAALSDRQQRDAEQQGGWVHDRLTGAARSIGQMAPFMVAPGGAVGRMAGMIGGGMVQEAADARQTAIEQGLSEDEARRYIVSNALAEGLPPAVFSAVGFGGAEKFAAGIPKNLLKLLGKGGDDALNAARKIAADSAKNAFKEAGKVIGRGVAEEVPEELITAVWQTVEQSAVDPRTAPQNAGDWLTILANTTAEVALSTAMLGTPAAVNTARQVRRTGLEMGGAAEMQTPEPANIPGDTQGSVRDNRQEPEVTPVGETISGGILPRNPADFQPQAQPEWTNRISRALKAEVVQEKRGGMQGHSIKMKHGDIFVTGLDEINNPMNKVNFLQSVAVEHINSQDPLREVAAIAAGNALQSGEQSDIDVAFNAAMAAGIRATGATVTFTKGQQKDLLGIVYLSNPNADSKTLDHELFHAALPFFLNAREYRVLQHKFRRNGKFDEEAAVDAYLDTIRYHEKYGKGLDKYGTAVEKAFNNLHTGFRDFLGGVFGKDFDQISRELYSGIAQERGIQTTEQEQAARGAKDPAARFNFGNRKIYKRPVDRTADTIAEAGTLLERAQKPPQGVQATSEDILAGKTVEDVQKPTYPPEWDNYKHWHNKKLVDHARERGVNIYRKRKKVDRQKIIRELNNMNKDNTWAKITMPADEGKDETLSAFYSDVLNSGIAPPGDTSSYVDWGYPEGLHGLRKALQQRGKKFIIRKGSRTWDQWIQEAANNGLLPRDAEATDLFKLLEQAKAESRRKTKEVPVGRVTIDEHLAPKEDIETIPDDEVLFSTIDDQTKREYDMLVMKAGGDKNAAWTLYENQLIAAQKRGEEPDPGRITQMRGLLLGTGNQGDLFGETAPEKPKREFKKPVDRPVQQSLEGLDDGMLFSTVENSSDNTFTGKKFREIADQIKPDLLPDKLIQPKGNEASKKRIAAQTYKNMPEGITAFDGTQVLLHNPEKGSLLNRLLHLVTYGDRKTVDNQKMKWLPLVPDTLQNAHVKLKDDKNGNHVYMRRYGDTFHAVIVDPRGVTVGTNVYDGALKTQFPDKRGGRRNDFNVIRERYGQKDFQQNLTPDLSDTNGAEPSHQDNKSLPQPPEDVKFSTAREAHPEGIDAKFSTTDTTSRPVPLPELAQMTVVMLGSQPQIRRKMQALGLFKREGDVGGIKLKADIFIGPDLKHSFSRTKPTKKQIDEHIKQMAEEHGIPEEDVVIKTSRQKNGWLTSTYKRDHNYAGWILAHEIGHAEDWLPDKNMGRGNLLGRIAKLNVFMGDLIGTSPETVDETITDEEQQRWQQEAAEPIEGGWEEVTRIIEEFVPGSGITVDDVKAIWNSAESAKGTPLYDFMSKLDNKEKVRIARSAMKGVVDPALAGLSGGTTVKKAVTERVQRLARQRTKKEIMERFNAKLKEEIQKRGLYEQEVIKKELIGLSKWWRGDFKERGGTSYDKYRRSSKELYADALSALLNNPEVLAQMAPQFHSAMNAYMGVREDFRDLYNGILDELNSGATPEQRLARDREMMSKDGEIRNKAIAEKGKDIPKTHIWKKMVYDLADTTAYLPTKEARLAVKDIGYLAGKLTQFQRDMRDQVVKPLEDAGISFDDMGVYLMRRRAATERADMANPGLIRGKDAEAELETLRQDLGEDNYAVLEKAAKTFTDIRKRHIIPKLRESRLFSEELMQVIQNNDEYATFAVADYYGQENDGWKTGAASLIKKQYGTSKDILNPFFETIHKDMKLLWAAQVNTSKRIMVDQMRRFDGKNIKDAETRFNGMSQAPVPPSKKGWGLVTYAQGGTVQGVYVRKEISDMFNITPGESNPLWQGFELATAGLKAMFTANNPLFSIWNIQRDARSTLHNIPTKNVAGEITLAPDLTLSYLKTIKDAYQHAFLRHSTPLMRELLENGRVIADRQWTARDKSFVNEYERLQAEFSLSPKKMERFYRKIGRWIFHDFNQMVEVWSKLAGAEYMKRKGLTDQYDMRDIMRGIVGSPDFLNRGRITRYTNTIFLYSNAQIQGLDAAQRAFRMQPAKYLMRRALYTVLPTLAMAYLQFGDDDDEEIKDYRDAVRAIPEYEKNRMITLPIGWAGKAVSYIPMPLDHIGELMHTIIWNTVASKDPNASKKIFSALLGSVPMEPGSLNPILDIGRAALQYIAKQNPYDMFRGRPVVDETIFRAGGFRSAEEFGKWMWNQTGGSTFGRFGYTYSTKPKSERDMPLIEPSMRRFIRTSDRGAFEKDQFEQDVKDKERAQVLVQAKDFASEFIRNAKTKDQASVRKAWTAYKPDAPQGYKYADFRRIYNNLYEKRWPKK